MLKHALAVLMATCLLLTGFAASAQELMEFPAFERAFVSRLQKDLAGATVTRDLEENAIRVQLPNDEERLIFLDRFYQRYRAGESFDDVFASMRSILDVDNARGADFNRSISYVLVRPTSYIVPEMNDEGPDNRPITRPLAGDLLLFLGLDHGPAYSYPPRASIEDLGSEDELWDEALARTLDALGEISLIAYDRPGEPTVYLLAAENTHLGASLLVDDATWDAPGIKAIGAEIVALPTRDAVLLADAGDPRAVALLRQIMINTVDEPSALTNTLIVRRNGRWQALDR